jgi:DNA-binding MarR family transcriptional regulator
VSALQYTALTVLWRKDGLTLTELAHNSFVTVQSMADLVRSLLRRELITRRPDPDHGRRQLVSLSQTGHALLERYEKEVATLERTMLSSLSDGESEDLRRMLALCRRALS